MSNTNCYECIHRRNIPGNTHSQCVHPKSGLAMSGDAWDSAVAIVSVLMGNGPQRKPEDRLNIMANPHGINNGWFYHPFNYDPAWLVSCDGFTPKEQQ